MMTKWYVKDLSKLTNVSVQTLHYYDRIGLLKPSLRRPNGYRLYSEKDLIKLQQIISLKFFGFGIKQLKILLLGDADVQEHFVAQTRFLQDKIDTLISAKKTLEGIIASCCYNKSIDWETVIKSIEVYYMTQKLEKCWVKEVLTPEEFKQYANFELGLKKRFTIEQQQSFEKSWAQVVKQIKTNLRQDPKSNIGMKIAKQAMDLINELYGQENANLKNALWEKGFKKGYAEQDHLLSVEAVTWLDNAIDSYYENSIINILVQAEDPTPDLSKQWNVLMDEMFGNDQALKKKALDRTITHSSKNKKVTAWLKQFAK